MSIIKAVNLHKTFDNGVEAVKGLNIEIDKGEVFGFLGPNGAGKSTSINMMIGLLTPTSGCIEIMNLNVQKNAKEIVKHIGYVPQELIFYNHLSVYENLELFASCYELAKSKDRINEVLQLLQIDELRNRKSAELSGGQKRRLNLAIGLLHTPEILFLDEPSAGMDPQSRNILWENIEALSKHSGITIILTTHLMETAERLSDRIAIIDHGVVQVVDTPENLKKKFGHSDVIELEFKDDISENNFNKIASLLKNNFGEKSIIQNHNKISISSSDGINTIISAHNLISNNNNPKLIKQVIMHETTMEDVFITITGSKLRE